MGHLLWSRESREPWRNHWLLYCSRSLRKYVHWRDDRKPIRDSDKWGISNFLFREWISHGRRWVSSKIRWFWFTCMGNLLWGFFYIYRRNYNRSFREYIYN